MCQYINKIWHYFLTPRDQSMVPYLMSKFEKDSQMYFFCNKDLKTGNTVCLVPLLYDCNVSAQPIFRPRYRLAFLVTFYISCHFLRFQRAIFPLIQNIESIKIFFYPYAPPSMEQLDLSPLNILDFRVFYLKNLFVVFDTLYI